VLPLTVLHCFVFLELYHVLEVFLKVNFTQLVK
jgi:hypothetical protein